MWSVKKIETMSSLELFKVLKLRVDTFVVAQNRIYPELDANDLKAFHIYYQDDQTGAITAYARVFKEEDHVTFGRVVVAEEQRGTGLGNTLLDQIMACCQQYWPDTLVIIEAQIQVTGYYEKHGFTIHGEKFIFNSTPHIQMRYQHARPL
ncbi:GNAT family N-acetyltransferase [Agrilactobacillus yilanensis]|uniref:GNAT family N-acetyltransferase n=1 Tax=Agrilactobacillus yilanensis TaxID=2485997 RepID=A0ABW4J4G8_9LACO|nr:GNAT family N-acetyltransferase [Agrilactobacillus yilanensis]